jgi:hypothetical protein
VLGGMLPAFGEYLWWHDDKEGHARRKSVSTHLPLFFEGGGGMLAVCWLHAN